MKVEKSGPRHKLIARRWRLVLLVLGLLYSVGAIGWVAFPLIPESWSGDFLVAGLLGTPLTISPFVDTRAHDPHSAVSHPQASRKHGGR